MDLISRIAFAAVASTVLFAAPAVAQPSLDKSDPPFRDASICRNELPNDFGNNLPTAIDNLSDEQADKLAENYWFRAWQLYFEGECAAARKFAAASMRVNDPPSRRPGGMPGDHTISLGYLIRLTREPRLDYGVEAPNLTYGSKMRPDFSGPIDNWIERRSPMGLCTLVALREMWPTKDFPARLKRYFEFDAKTCPEPPFQGKAEICREEPPLEPIGRAETIEAIKVAGRPKVMQDSTSKAWQHFWAGECAAAKRYARHALTIAAGMVTRREIADSIARSNEYLISLTFEKRAPLPCGRVAGAREYSCEVADWLQSRDSRGLCAIVQDRSRWPTADFPRRLKQQFDLDPKTCERS